MENTEQLRSWIKQQVETGFEGNLTAFADKTHVSRQTWMNILSSKYRSLRQQAIRDLCNLFALNELDLYRIAHPEIGATGILKEAAETYRTPDDADRLAEYLRKASNKDRKFIYEAAERCGFDRNNK